MSQSHAMRSALEVRQITDDETLPLRQMVLRPNRPITESRFQGDQGLHAGHFGVFDDGKLIAVGSVVPDTCTHESADESMRKPGAWRLRGMATSPEARSRGAGALVLRACLEFAKSHGGTLVWCHARVGAAEFYLRNGFQKLSEVYEVPQIGPHYLMKHDLLKLP